jgi:hypothetical protein
VRSEISFSHALQTPWCIVCRYPLEANAQNQTRCSTELPNFTEFAGTNARHPTIHPVPSCMFLLLDSVNSANFVQKLPPPAFPQKPPPCPRCYRSAITTLFFNKNAFNAILEACFLKPIQKKASIRTIRFRSFVPHGTIFLNLPYFRLVKIQAP